MAFGNMNIGVDSEFIPSNLNTVLPPPRRGCRRCAEAGCRGGSPQATKCGVELE